MNNLYYGDNLDVMRRRLKDETVDLVYLDPPFNHNVLFRKPKMASPTIVPSFHVYMDRLCVSLMTGGKRICLN